MPNDIHIIIYILEDSQPHISECGRRERSTRDAQLISRSGRRSWVFTSARKVAHQPKSVNRNVNRGVETVNRALGKCESPVNRGQVGRSDHGSQARVGASNSHDCQCKSVFVCPLVADAGLSFPLPNKDPRSVKLTPAAAE